MPSSGASFSQITPLTPRVVGIDYIAVPKPGQYHPAYYPYCPYLTHQPDSQGVFPGEPASFSIIAAAPEVTYQWQVSVNSGTSWASLGNEAPYTGVRTATLEISAATEDMSGYEYRCVLSSPGCDVISAPATLTVDDACASISDQPDDATVNENDDTSFTITASVPVGSIAYQWEVSTNGGGTWAPLSNDATYSGVTTNALGITDAGSGLNDHLYRCVLSNLGCDVISNSAMLTVLSCPNITVQPANESADACASAEFSLSLDFVFPGTTYQWQISTNSGGLWTNITDDSTYSGATTDTLSIDPVPFGGDGYWYRCVISRAGCSNVTSDHAVLTVVEDPQVTQWVGYVNSAGGGFAADSLDIARALVCQINLSGFANKIQWLLPLLGTGIGAARAPLIDRLGDGLAVNNNFVNGDFSQSTGLQGNGTNKTFDTGIKFTDLGVSSESGIGWWENNINLAGNVHPMGNYALGLLGQYRYVLDLRSFTRSYVYGATATNACGQAVSAVNGHYYGQRNSGSIRKIFLGGSQISTNTFVGAENGIGSQTIVVCGNSNQSGAYEPWPGRCAVAYMTDGTLTDGEVATLNQLLIDYLFTPTGRPYT